MIGLDTNVLVRYLTQDDPAQSRLATALIDRRLSARNRGFVSSIVLVETLWVLSESYGVSREEQTACVEQLARTRQFELEHVTAVGRAVTQAHRAKCGVVDCLIAEIAQEHGCDFVYTFDKKASASLRFKLLS